MTVVSNTSPIINLAAIGHLELLQALYENIIVPDAVYDEIVVKGRGQAGADDIRNSDWIHRQSLKNPVLAQALLAELDDGEAAAIALAVELKADVLLMDERMGRAVAKRFGLKCVGLLGVPTEAKHEGLIDAVKPLLDDLRIQAGFWINQQLYAKVLFATGE